jgi:predicted acylesterase/phospholipase RssA
MELPPTLSRDDYNELFGDVPQRIGVALSGGGLRASLHGFGVLTALVDLGLNSQSAQIASVSGGSMTNAFVALRSDFSNVKPDDFDRIVREFSCLVVKKGLVPLWPTIVILTLGIGGVSAAVGALVYGLLRFFGVASPQSTNAGIIAGAGSLFALWLCRGHVFEWYLYRRLYRAPSTRGPARFSDLAEGRTEHVVCATDVPTGQPFYFTSRDGGRFSLRRKPIAQDYEGSWTMRCCNGLRVATAVRASGALPPLIPPKLLKLRHFKHSCEACAPFATQREGDPRHVFLSDGGVWNNLGTQALEDAVFPGHVDCLLVANASALLKRTRSWYLFVPLVAEFMALMRNADIQNFNTVAPRRRATRRVAELEAWGSYKAPMFEWIIDSTKAPSDTLLDLTRHVLFRSDEAKAACNELASSYALLEAEVSATGKLTSELAMPTTRRKPSAEEAKRLILRGYSNTHLWAAAQELTFVTLPPMTAERLATFVS